MSSAAGFNTELTCDIARLYCTKLFCFKVFLYNEKV